MAFNSWINGAYLRHELQRRWGRTVVTALGLAAGVGLVMGITGVSAGLTQAQNQVLSPLSSVGTDIIVTRTVGATAPNPSASPTPTPDNGFGGGFFGGGRFNRNATQLNSQDVSALLNANSSVLTDLSKLGPAGTKFVHDFFVPGTLITFPENQALADVLKVPGVQSAVPGLSLQAIHESGTVPKISDTFTTGGQTLTTRPRLTDAQRAQLESCLAAHGVPTPDPSGSRSGGGFGFRGDFGGAAADCFQQFQFDVQVPSQVITRVLNPPPTDTSTKTYTAGGVDPASTTTGLVTASQITSGGWFSSHPAGEVLVNTAYASSNNIKAGQTLSINGTNYTVRGLVSPTLTGDVSDIYFDITTLQKLSDNSASSTPAAAASPSPSASPSTTPAPSPGPAAASSNSSSTTPPADRINEILVKVSNAGNVDAVAAAIHSALPGAQVLTAKSLADQVTGSLANAQTLASTLGVAMAVIILLAAFLIAVLLTTSSVSKRVREIGTLRAIGWKRGRVVRQIMAETAAIGVVGAVLGVLLGLGVAEAVNIFGPTLDSTTTGAAVGASTAGALFHQATTASSQTTVHMQSLIGVGTVLLGIGCALVGGLLAGALGGWRASRLAPAAALRDIG